MPTVDDDDDVQRHIGFHHRISAPPSALLLADGDDTTALRALLRLSRLASAMIDAPPKSAARLVKIARTAPPFHGRHGKIRIKPDFATQRRRRNTTVNKTSFRPPSREID